MMDKKYEYYVFMDEDIVVSNLTLWEETLFRYRPAVGVPGGIAQVHRMCAVCWLVAFSASNVHPCYLCASCYHHLACSGVMT